MTTAPVKTEILHDEEFERRLDLEVRRAEELGRPYAVLAVMPQHFVGEDVSDAVMQAAHCTHGLMRSDDLVGRLDREMIVVGLRDADHTSARIFGHRLAGDLALLLAGHQRATVWEAGIALLPDDGSNGQHLLARAIEDARTRRIRLAML